MLLHQITAFLIGSTLILSVFGLPQSLVTYLWNGSTCCWTLYYLVIMIHRYLRTVVNCISHWCYKSIRIPEKPSYTSNDVTVIIPTIHHNFEELRESIQSILACHPYELLLVTTSDKYQKLVNFTKSLEASNIRVFHTAIANKRLQVCEAIPMVKTEFIIMVDDDVTWPSTILPWLLAPFEDPKMGAVGPCQRVKRVQSGPFIPRVFNFLGALYIERRNWEISATHNIDGGTSCMSGRTCAFRAGILQSHEFLCGFKTERWGPYHLNADDDNFITRWLVSHNWLTWIQYNRECEIETTLENNIKFLYQCSRWARSNWRSNYTSLFTERHVWRQQPWSTYALHFATFTSLSFVFDPLAIVALLRATRNWSPSAWCCALTAQLTFMFLIKVVKQIGLLLRNPSDILFLPIAILFGYFHGLIKLYALYTLHMTSWGSRADGDANDSHRMSPRPQRSESITLPPGKHPMLIRYREDAAFTSEKTDLFITDEASANSRECEDAKNPTVVARSCEIEVADESDLDVATDDSYDPTDSTDISRNNSSASLSECSGR